jgi:hypothetical protein
MYVYAGWRVKCSVVSFVCVCVCVCVCVDPVGMEAARTLNTLKNTL